jgi:hypothetical protein
LELRLKAESNEKPEDGTEIIHCGDLYAIGGNFNITGGLDNVVMKKGFILDKPSRDTLKVKWLEVMPGERIGQIV